MLIITGIFFLVEEGKGGIFETVWDLCVLEMQLLSLERACLNIILVPTFCLALSTTVAKREKGPWERKAQVIELRSTPPFLLWPN